MRCYYAHPITTYGTQDEQRDIENLQRMGFEVLNPNKQEYEILYKEKGMQVFLDLVDSCDCLAFRAFDDSNASIPAGVWKEICRADGNGKPFFELTGGISERVLTVEGTRNMLTAYGRK